MFEPSESIDDSLSRIDFPGNCVTQPGGLVHQSEMGETDIQDNVVVAGGGYR